jgi:hypothetical protein
VVVALWANIEVALNFRPVQDGTAGRALCPQALGHRPRPALGLDA